MRQLTVRREKSFVACLAKDKVYIEDHYAGDTVIGGVPCRKLGDLKNGEVKTFIVGDEAARVYVISDKLSKDFCNDFFILPAGDFPIFLSGKHAYNPVAGNAFRFNDNAHPEAVANRKRGGRIGIVVLIVAAIVGFFVGFFSNVWEDEAQDKTFTASGMSITLTDAFIDDEMEGFTATWATEDVVVVALEEPFHTLTDVLPNPSTASVEEYLRLLIEHNGEGNAVETVDGLPRYYYDWENVEAGVTYRYFVYAFKSDDAFWMVQIVVDVESLDKYEDDVSRWAHSVTFRNADI